MPPSQKTPRARARISFPGHRASYRVLSSTVMKAVSVRYRSSLHGCICVAVQRAPSPSRASPSSHSRERSPRRRARTPNLRTRARATCRSPPPPAARCETSPSPRRHLSRPDTGASPRTSQGVSQRRRHVARRASDLDGERGIILDSVVVKIFPRLKKKSRRRSLSRVSRVAYNTSIVTLVTSAPPGAVPCSPCFSMYARTPGASASRSSSASKSPPSPNAVGVPGAARNAARSASIVRIPVLEMASLTSSICSTRAFGPMPTPGHPDLPLSATTCAHARWNASLSRHLPSRKSR